MAGGVAVERTDFVNVATTDLARAVRFYGEVLGLPRNPRSSDEWPEFETGNLTLLLVTPEQIGRSEFAPSTHSIALRVPDVDEARKQLEEQGVEFHGDVLDTGVCKMTFFADPDGNALTLHHRYAPYADGTQP